MLQGVFTSFEFEFGFHNLAALLIKLQNNTAKKPPWSQPKKKPSLVMYSTQNSQEKVKHFLPNIPNKCFKSLLDFPWWISPCRVISSKLWFIFQLKKREKMAERKRASVWMRERRQHAKNSPFFPIFFFKFCWLKEMGIGWVRVYSLNDLFMFWTLSSLDLLRGSKEF